MRLDLDGLWGRLAVGAIEAVLALRQGPPELQRKLVGAGGYFEAGVLGELVGQTRHERLLRCLGHCRVGSRQDVRNGGVESSEARGAPISGTG